MISIHLPTRCVQISQNMIWLWQKNDLATGCGCVQFIKQALILAPTKVMKKKEPGSYQVLLRITDFSKAQENRNNTGREYYQ